MSRYSSHDPYTDPASSILKNRLGIADTAALEATEAALVAIRSYELLERPLVGHFDLVHLQAVHRYLFGDVYEWAGMLMVSLIALRTISAR
jgi:cell filamentation protein